MHANKEGHSKDFENMSNLSIETDLSDVGLCSLNIHEHTYNSLMCHLMV